MGELNMFPCVSTNKVTYDLSIVVNTTKGGSPLDAGRCFLPALKRRGFHSAKSCDRMILHSKSPLQIWGAIGQAVTAALPFSAAYYSTSSAKWGVACTA